MNAFAVQLDLAADRVRRRLAVSTALRLAERWALPAMAGLCAAGSLSVLGGIGLGRPWLVALGGALAGAVLLAAWLRRPARPAALAAWDAATGRRMQFASAWWFLHQRDGDQPLARLHCSRAADGLPAALPALAGDLPLPRLRRLPVALALLAVVLAIDPFRAPLRPAREQLDEAAVARAHSAARELATAKLDRTAGLEAGERKQVDELNKGLSEVARRLAEAGQTPHEMLADLDRLARAAEALAGQLAGDAGKLQQLAEALEGHADLSALAEALRKTDQNATAAALEALAQRLDKGLSNDERRRLAEAMAQALGAAGAAAQQSAAGSALAQAQQALAQGQPAAAAQALRAAAQAHQRQAQRQAAGQQMQQLASRLRQTGAGIAGRQSAAQRLASSAAGQQSGRSGSRQPSQAPLSQQWNPPSANRGGGQGKGQGKGQGQGACAGGGNRPPVPGAGGGQGGAPPVPGQRPGQGAGAGSGTGRGQAPVPGVAAAQGAGKGGTKAGRGSVALGRDDRRIASQAKTSTVEPAATGAGDSEVRETTSGEHHEATAVPVRETALQTLTAEEEAIDIEHVPLVRRADLLRYFIAVRLSLEQ